MDRQSVEFGDLDGLDVLEGVIDSITQLLAKIDGKGWINGYGYRFPGDDGSWPEEIDHG